MKIGSYYENNGKKSMRSQEDTLIQKSLRTFFKPSFAKLIIIIIVWLGGQLQNAPKFTPNPPFCIVLVQHSK